MRSLEIYKSGVLAGILNEESHQKYVFSYNDDFLKSSVPALSLTLRKRAEPYVSTNLFPFFANMLPEGDNRSTICRMNKLDEADLFGILMAFSGKDIIGDVTVKSIV